MRGAAGIAALGAMALAACTPDPATEPAQPIDVRTDWAQVPVDAAWGEVSAVDVDSHGHVFVLQRAGRTWSEPFPTQPIARPVVFMFDADGGLLAQWGEGETVMPHGLSIDEADKVWITDVQREQLLRFSHDGALEDAWGSRGAAGNGPRSFGRPSDTAHDRGTVYVADGYSNSRVAVFDAEGRFDRQWGVPGKGKNGLNLPHGVAFVDGWVYIADRENRRIKVHRGDGALIAIWDVPGHPYAVKAIRDGRIATLEGRDAGGASIAVLRLWSAGGVQQAAFDLGARLGSVKGHDLAIGPDGTVYIADVEGRRLLTARLPRSNGS